MPDMQSVSSPPLLKVIVLTWPLFRECYISLKWYILWLHRPVPELPGKSTFFGSSDEFIEKRRQGLQHFLEKWVDLPGCWGGGRGRGRGRFQNICGWRLSWAFESSVLTEARSPSGMELENSSLECSLCCALCVTAGSCRVWSFCQTASCTSSCKASSRCLR
jgi:hypothetical protein